MKPDRRYDSHLTRLDRLTLRLVSSPWFVTGMLWLAAVILTGLMGLVILVAIKGGWL